MDIMTKNNLLGADGRSGSDGRGRQDVSFGRQTPRKIAMDDGCGVVTKDGEIAQGRGRRGRQSKSKIVEKRKRKRKKGVVEEEKRHSVFYCLCFAT